MNGLLHYLCMCVTILEGKSFVIIPNCPIQATVMITMTDMR